MVTILLNPKSEILNSKQILMLQIPNHKTNQYDLEERTFQFAKRVNRYVNKLPKTTSNVENGRQLVRAAGSVGANYIEANESLSKKDFAMRIKISKKEAKESSYWLRLTNPSQEDDEEKKFLVQEAIQLMKIFGSILEKSK